jgi:SAM-dependent methyltransferase
MRMVQKRQGGVEKITMPAHSAHILSWYYHLHHKGYTEDLPFWLELADRQGGPILELGCGTGRVMLSLAQAGYVLYGLDRDADGLAVLRQGRSASSGGRVHLVQADMRAFHFGTRFPLILLPCNTYSTFPASERRGILALIFTHLAAGGWFATSLPNPDRMARLPIQGESEIEEIFTHPISQEPVQVSSSWERHGRNLHIRWHYDHLLPDGRVDRQTLQTHHYLDRPQVYLAELLAAGFQLVAVYGDFDRSAYDQAGPALIFIACRAS